MRTVTNPIAAGLSPDVEIEGRPAPTLQDRVELAEAAPDRLLREFLGDLLYRFAAEGKVYTQVRFESITPTSLRAGGWRLGRTNACPPGLQRRPPGAAALT